MHIKHMSNIALNRYLRGHEGGITCLEGLNCSGAGAGGGSGGGLGHTLVASGSVDRTVRVWDSRQRKAQVSDLSHLKEACYSERWLGRD